MITAALQHVDKSYGQGARRQAALSGIDFVLAPGEFVFLWGPSGSGKTTFLNILGLLDRPDAGEVLIDGERVADWSEAKRSDYRGRRIGFVFQTGDLLPVLSAEQNVRLPLDIAGVDPRTGAARALETLSLVGLSAHRDKRPDQLSGGQRQRVAVARALVTNPLFVLADEPTANLDTENTMLIMEMLRSLRNDLGITVLVSTHDSRLLAHATRRVTLVDGRIVEDTSVSPEQS